MLFGTTLSELPSVTRAYTVTRRTVWQISENEHILIFIRHGKCVISTGGEQYDLEAGDVFFIPAETSYKRTPCGETKCTMTYVHFVTNTAFFEQDRESVYERIENLSANEPAFLENKTIYLERKSTPVKSESINRCVSEISSALSHRNISSTLKASAMLSEILVSLSEQALSDMGSKKRIHNRKKVPQNLKKAIDYIMQHYSERITLDMLASHCAVSKQQMIRYFKAAYGMTPNNYITEYKLSRAKELLYNCPLMTINEISARLGFDNQHYFSRVFVKFCGETPSDFRYRTVNYGKLSKNLSKLP